MDCEQAKSELIAYLNEELGADKKKRLEDHLAKCAACRADLESARTVLSWTESASDLSVVKRIHKIIAEAAESNASDIHFEPQFDGTLRVRLRIDGVLGDIEPIDSEQHHGIIARLKLMGGMKVSETQLPQDGRTRFRHKDMEGDIRLTSMPMVYGESITGRILMQSLNLPDLQGLGFHPDQVKDVKELLHHPCGLLVITGPTGAGRTTTGFRFLKELESPALKMLTIENPVECVFRGINQAQVNTAAGLDFSRAIRAFLRLDPDIIYVGELQNPEVAELCIQAAATGHLVISTLFALTAVEAIELLVEMYHQRHMVGYSVIGVVAQRLVRRVCPNCREDAKVSPHDPALEFLGITPDDLKKHQLLRGKGCEKCGGRGYYGRTAVFEVLTVDNDLARMIARGATIEELQKALDAKGFVSMKDSARQKVLEGITTADEAMRVLM